MSSNFKILTRRARGHVYLKLLGDFDGTSAHALLNAIRSCERRVSRLTIHTDGLREIHPFGLRVFGTACSDISSRIPPLEFTGANAKRLAAAMPGAWLA